MNKIAYPAVLLLLLVLGIGPANLVYFIDPGSLIITGIPTAVAYSVAVKRSRRAGLWAALHVAWISGILGTIIGLVLMAQNWPIAQEVLFPGLAVAAITFFYSIIVVLALLPYAIAQPEEPKSN